MLNVFTIPLFFNITVLLVNIPIVWWLLKSRQQLTVFFVFMLLLLFFINNPLPETKIVVLQSVPCEFPDDFFMNNLLNKLTDKTAIRKLSDCYTEEKGQHEFILKPNLSTVEKKELLEILETTAYDRARVTFWAPAFLEPGVEKQVTIAIDYRGRETENIYRISAALNENILLGGALAAKNTEEDKVRSRDYRSNILFQGTVKNDEVLSKQISLLCLNRDWQECELMLKLERLIQSGTAAQWREEGCERFSIKEAYKLNSLMPQISGLIALITSIMTILLKLVDTWQKKQEQN